MKPLHECRLYTFVDSAYLHGRDPVDVARQLCEGGSDIIQLRAKDWPVERTLETARRILPIARDHGVALVINDHLQIAQQIGADFCHLGQEDFFDAGHSHVSQLSAAPHQPLIGLSTHAPDQALRAIGAGPSYIAIGPVYPTGTKPSARPVTLDYVKWAAANVSIPWFAIGGISLENLAEVVGAGARRICVVSALLNDPDLQSACCAFRARLGP